MTTAVLERPAFADYVKRIVDEAPTLTAETRERIISLIRIGDSK